MSKHRRKRQRRHAASIRPKRAIVERLTRELRRGRVRPEVLEQAAAGDDIRRQSMELARRLFEFLEREHPQRLLSGHAGRRQPRCSALSN